jgi:hypothetical protein
MANRLQRNGRLPEGGGVGKTIAIVCFAAVIIFYGLNRLGRTPTRIESTANRSNNIANASDNAASKECEKRVQECCVATGIIQTMQFTRGHLRVYVRPDLWNQADLSLKNSIADTVDCAAAGPGKSLMGTQYIDSKSGKILHVWNGLELEAQ